MLHQSNLPRGFNAADYFIGRHESRLTKPAYIDDNGTTTYGELVCGVNQAANAFAAMGLAPETRIALVMLDSIAFPLAFWGAIKAGLVPVPINTLLTTENYEYIIRDCRAPVALISEELMETVQPALQEQEYLKQQYIVREGAPHKCDFLLMLEDKPNKCASATTCADDVAFWAYSSGSTGRPKGIKHLHRNLVCVVETFGQQVLGITEDDVVFSAAKLFFAYGLGNAMLFPLSVGATVLLKRDRPSPTMIFEIFAQHDLSIFYGVPTLYAAMLGHALTDDIAVPSRMRVCVSAGEALPAEIGQRWQQRTGVPVLDGVGSTEMLHIFMSNRVDDIRYGSSGTPVPGYEAKLVDENGRSVTQGEIGELAVAGDSSAEGYWNQHDKSKRTFVGRWTYTGDKYYQDEAGYYYICGRTDDMFKSGGNWVSPFDIEACLITHPAVLEAGVVPKEDEYGNTKPKAFVVLNSPFVGDKNLAAELQEHVKARIELWKYPRWIEFKNDLPKTATGKIQRYKLRDE
ncbi:MAG: benzoate-CoA ligase family protein [Gammaproteobacteria bacterium]